MFEKTLMPYGEAQMAQAEQVCEDCVVPCQLWKSPTGEDVFNPSGPDECHIIPTP